MRKISLGDVGLHYFQAMLANEIGLCAKLRHCNFGVGSFSTFVPDGSKSYNVGNPYAGGLLSPHEASQAFSYICDYLRDKMPEAKGGVLIVQSPWSQPSDAVPRHSSDSMLSLKGFGVCHSSSIDLLNEDELNFLTGDTVARPDHLSVLCFPEWG